MFKNCVCKYCTIKCDAGSLDSEKGSTRQEAKPKTLIQTPKVKQKTKKEKN